MCSCCHKIDKNNLKIGRRYVCECGIEGIGYHPIYGEAHSPGDSFAYKFEYIK